MVQSTFLVAVLLLLSAPLRAQDAVSEETIRFFQQNCSSCHTIGGGRLTGPDLKDVEQRRDREWLLRFMPDPKAMIDSGDPYAQQLFTEARGTYMTQIPGLTRDRAGKLLDLIAYESTLEKSRFMGIQISDRPLTPEDAARGRDLFQGLLAFESGAPACVSCHTTGGVTGLGGGRLGPDLTAVYARLEGRKPLAAWLAAPPGPTMQPVFANRALDGEEVLALVAYLKDQAQQGAAQAEPRVLQFVLAGLGLVAVLLAVFDLAWRLRFRAVRAPLVARN